jgi:hypothetical protein
MMQQEKMGPVPLKKILPLSLVFLILSAIGIFRHELWLDEAQHFLIARDSDSLAEVYVHMQYDGHVRLWNFLLYFITHYISASPLSMQIFHWLIINATVFILLRSAPFRIPVKWMIVFGYFFLYEYDVIARNYAPGILLVFACCALLRDFQKNMLWVSLLLILMCNMHLFFVFAAISIGLWVTTSSWQIGKINLRFFIFLMLLAIGILSVVIQIDIPPDNTYFHPGEVAWHAAGNFFSAFYGFAKGMLPLPLSRNGDFWNHYLYDTLPVALKLFLSAGLLLYSIRLFYKNRPVLLFYLSGIFLLMIFLYASQMRASRYFGIFFIFFISAAWLDGYRGENILCVRMTRIRKEKFLLAFTYFLLICHVYAGIYAYLNDLTRPFTEAKNAVAFIKENHLDSNLIVVDGYGGGPALSAYLGKKVFYLNIDTTGSFCIWKRSYFEVPPRPLTEQLDRSTYVGSRQDFILVAVRAAPTGEIHTPKNTYFIEQLAGFTHSIIKPDYYIYRVTRRPP